VGNIEKKAILYFRNKVINWGKVNYVDYPWRLTDNIWHSIVAEIMLQRTKADQVIPVYKDFCEKYSSPQEFQNSLDFNENNIFSSLGLNWRNEILRSTTNYLVINGIPDNRIDFIKVPGIGDYVSSAVLSFHLGQRALLIDSNIVRLYCRYWGFEYNNESRRKRWLRELSDQLTPYKNVKQYNYSVLDFGMAICLPKPRCNSCPLKKKCSYFKNSIL